MCFVLYLASDRRRREIVWNKQTPAFFVSADDTGIEKVQKHFSKPFIYYLGSSSHCGCDFKTEPDYIFQQKPAEEQAVVRKNQTQLLSYLQECLADEDRIELLGCWSGEEDQPPARKRFLVMDELLSDEFHFNDSQPELVIVNPKPVENSGHE